jgi:hypothetical protein
MEDRFLEKRTHFWKGGNFPRREDPFLKKKINPNYAYKSNIKQKMV